MTSKVHVPKELVGFSRAEFEDTCKRRFFFGLAFDPYGGTAGLYDLGPTMCSMKSNLLHFWRHHFVIEENMCEVDTTCMTPEEVFNASGHVTRFNDTMVRDTVTGECIRADKLLEEFADNALATETLDAREMKTVRTLAGGMTVEELGETIKKYSVKSPKGNALSEPFPFNLMFKTSIGPEGQKVGFMRPELAQGIILNYKRLVSTGNAQRMPFAGACIGVAFRNEIAPRAALIRVREFTLAEIEHFVNPNNKKHARFHEVARVSFWGWSRERQISGEEPVLMTIGDAVEKKIIDNETVGYFVGRVQLFMEFIGVKFVRFRQHLRNEMAHYATDCWDCELLTSYGYVECVGIADRSAYDLQCHSAASGKELVAREDYETPIVKHVHKAKINKALAGKRFAKETGNVLKYIEGLSDKEAVELEHKLTTDGKTSVILPSGATIELTDDVVSFSEEKVKISGYNYTPNVIEPSFGIGRILYCLLEQSYWVRRQPGNEKNEKRAVFSLVPLIAPQKVAILPLMVKPELEPVIADLRRRLVREGLSNRVDDSGAAIGKKYARVDELGIPFCITCDFENDGAVTLRERDSSQQVRVSIEEVTGVVAALCKTVDPMNWSDVIAKYPLQKSNDEN